VYTDTRKEYPAGLAAIRSLRGRGDQSPARDTVPSGTSLVSIIGGVMDREPAAGRRSHRRLIACLLALALGATLGVGAPQALAGPKDAHLSLGDSITLRVSPGSLSPKEIIAAAGEVMPVERVGDFVTISIEKKSAKGKWKKVSSTREQVQFKAPASWSGKWNARQDSVGTVDARVGTLADWQGTVLFEHPTINLKGHYVDYEMTWAAGTSTYEGVNYDGEGVLWGLYKYIGYPLKTAGAKADLGRLRWYFAESPDGIYIDSYEGNSYHLTEGVFTVTSLKSSPPTVTEAPAYMYDSDTMWSAGDSGPRYRLQIDGRMKNKLVRPGALGNGVSETVTMVSDWDLAPSETIEMNTDLREGYYTGKTSIAKPGDYHIRAEIGGVGSKWIKLKVK